MDGGELKAFRETRGLSQGDFAAWLNEQLGRKYDKQKVSRWEVGSERIPAPVACLVPRPEHVVGPALVVAVANQKGGVGKTVTTVNVAALLAQRGFAVLLIDADPQANATMHLGVNPYEVVDGKQRPTLYTSLRSEGGGELHEIAVPVGDRGLKVVPSSIKLAEIEPELIAQSGGEHALAERMVACRGRFDFILIDTPPNIGQMTKNALTAADAVLVPCQTAVFSVVGIDFLLKNITMTRRRSNPKLSILGILPTRYNKRLTNDVATLADIKEKFLGIKVFDPIPAAAIYDKTTASGMAAVDIDGSAPGVEVYKQIADEMVVLRQKLIGAGHVG